ncbi:MAG: glutamyl-tRNA reductase, partial [Deltaproteobacteria bacterium]|nr:glutamyl-tRNA reductase [Deltaproteobacteria bacterium]
KLVHKAFHVSKRIRTETGIGQLPISVSYVAILLAEKIFGNLTDTGVLLLGTGEMGALAARHLAERKVREIWISNRTGEKATSLASELGAKMVPFEHFAEKFESVDIVISSIHSDQPVIQAAQVREAMKRRKNRPMFFIDIAVPRNIDSEVNQVPNVYLYDMDHLQEIVTSNLCEREKEAVKAEEIIEQELAEFIQYLSQREISPTIQQLTKKFDAIRTAELEKYILKRSKLPEADRQAIEACTKAIVNKILHEPILLMKTEEVKEGGMKYSEILKKLFGLE